MPPDVGIIGGTGSEGSGLALRFARAGGRVLLGSRDPARAEAIAARLGAIARYGAIEGCSNADAVRRSRAIVLTVPLRAQIETLKSVRESFQPGSILVDATVPLEAAIGGRLSRMVTLWAGSAAEQAARNLPAGVAVVSAFHALSAELLSDLDRSVDCDVLICGDDERAKGAVSELVRTIAGARPVDAGALEQARYAETAGALLVALNLRYKVRRAGIRITGLGLD